MPPDQLELWLSSQTLRQTLRRTDFNSDGHPDYLLYNASTRQTALWYLNNNVHIGGASGPTLRPVGDLVGVADFNRDGHPDYLLSTPTTRDTVIWYHEQQRSHRRRSGPTLGPAGTVVGVADFNSDGHPDYLLFNPSTRQTAIWYLNNNVHHRPRFRAHSLAGWSVVGVADFNRRRSSGLPAVQSQARGRRRYGILTIMCSSATRLVPLLGPAGTWWVWRTLISDGHPDYLLFNPSTGQTAIWYLEQQRSHRPPRPDPLFLRLERGRALSGR